MLCIYYFWWISLFNIESIVFSLFYIGLKSKVKEAESSKSVVPILNERMRKRRCFADRDLEIAMFEREGIANESEHNAHVQWMPNRGSFTAVAVSPELFGCQKMVNEQTIKRFDILWIPPPNGISPFHPAISSIDRRPLLDTFRLNYGSMNHSESCWDSKMSQCLSKAEEAEKEQCNALRAMKSDADAEPTSTKGLKFSVASILAK